jgi:hypothetical protein
MTALAAPTALPIVPRSSIHRIASVMRLHLVDRWGWLYTPLIILSGSYVLTFAVFYLIGTYTTDGFAGATESATSGSYIGSVQAVFWYLLAMAVQSVSRMFPLALGLSATRRQFTLGTGAFFLAVAVAMGLVYSVLGVIETATGGWGIGLPMFTGFGLDAYPWYALIVVYGAAALLLMTLGSVFAAVYLRWKNLGVVLFSFALALLLIGLLALITLNDLWGSVGTWFVTNGVVGVSAWTLVLSAVSLGALHLLVRRATP